MQYVCPHGIIHLSVHSLHLFYSLGPLPNLKLPSCSISPLNGGTGGDMDNTPASYCLLQVENNTGSSKMLEELSCCIPTAWVPLTY